MSGLAAYRILRRSAKLLFKGDIFAERAAISQLRDEFLKNKNITDKAALNKLLRDVDEVDEMMRFNLVQGKKNERGNFEVKLSSEHHVTVENHQDRPHGPELEPIDVSVIGKPITVERVKGDKSKY